MNDIASAASTMASLPSLGAAGKLPGRLGHKDASSDQLRQAAKDFESVLMMQLLQEMKRTIPDSGLLEDPTGEQMQDLFWQYLAEDLADKGGMGLGEEIHRQMVLMSTAQPETEQLP